MKFSVSFESAKRRRDPNPKRTTALVHTLPWLEDEQLHHLYAVGIAAWQEQEYAGWLAGASSVELHEWWDNQA